MTLGAALKASRTLGQAINRSGTYSVTVAEKDDALFQAHQQPTVYIVSVMRYLTARKCFEPVYESQLGLSDIEVFLRHTGNCPLQTISTLPPGSRPIKPFSSNMPGWLIQDPII